MQDEQYVRSRYPRAEAQFHRQFKQPTLTAIDAEGGQDAEWVVYSQSEHDSRALGAGPTSQAAWQAAAAAVAAEQAGYEAQDDGYEGAAG